MPRYLMLMAALLMPALPLWGAESWSAPRPEWLPQPLRPPLEQREAELEPRELPLAQRLGELLGEQAWEPAIALLEEQLPEGEENPYGVLSAALSHLLGQLYLQQEDLPRAEAALLSAVAKLPAFVRAHQALGYIYLRQERHEEARVHVVRAISEGGIDAALYGYLGYLNQQVGNHWGAAAAYQQALMLEGDRLNWQQGLLYALIESSQFESALAWIDALLARQPAEASLWRYRAQAAMRLQRLPEALASLELALRLGEDDPAHRQLAARLHLQHGSLERALALIEPAPGEAIDVDLLVQALDWLIQRDRTQGARELAERLRRHWDLLPVTDRSRLLSREARLAGQAEEAVVLLERALELDPANADALLALAERHLQTGRLVQAELLFRRAAVYPPQRLRALVGQAQAAVEQFDYAAALELTRRALDEYPEQQALRDNLRVLENLAADGL